MSAVLAFVSIFVDPSRIDAVLSALSRIEGVREAYEVTGEFDVVSVVSSPDIERFRDVLKNGIMKIAGVKSTVTSIILNPIGYRAVSTYQARPRKAVPIVQF